MSANTALEHANKPDRSDYPSTLTTQADYKSAPVGTIVDIDGMLSERQINGWLINDDEPIELRSRYMPTVGEGAVVRWGADE